MSLTIVLDGKMGDIVYELAPARQLAENSNTQARVLLLQHDLGLTLDELQALVPFIESQPFVDSVAIWTGEHADYDFSEWFRDYIHQENILSSLFARLGVGSLYGRHPWLDVPAPCNQDLTLVNRTGRYPNDNVNWREVLEPFPEPHFVGLPQEHRAFCSLVRRELPFEETSLLELAQLIARCGQFLGNQSMPLALAHGLGKPVVVETSTERPNCIFLRPNAQYLGVDPRFVEAHGYPK